MTIFQSAFHKQWNRSRQLFFWEYCVKYYKSIHSFSSPQFLRFRSGSLLVNNTSQEKRDSLAEVGPMVVLHKAMFLVTWNAVALQVSREKRLLCVTAAKIFFNFLKNMLYYFFKYFFVMFFKILVLWWANIKLRFSFYSKECRSWKDWRAKTGVEKVLN